MICVHIRKSFIYLFHKNTYFLCKSHVSFSFSLRFFCTSGEREGRPVTALTVSEFLLHKHEFSPEAASLVTGLKNPQKSDSILSFLKESGFSNTQLEKIVKSRRQLLSASLDNTIKPKIKIFQDLDFSASEIAEIISKEPTILFCSASNRVIPSLSVLKGLLGSNEKVAKVLRKSGWFLIRDLDKTMVPNVEFLKSCGIPLEHILILLYTCPRCLLHKPEMMRNCVGKVDKLGADRSSKMFIHAVRVVSSMTNENWELKLQAFRDSGFSESDIVTMLRNAPQVFAGSAEKMRRIRELLLATGKYNMSCIVNFPRSLMSSIRNRYMPRLRVLGILEEKNLLKNWPSLATVSVIPDEKFHKKFVAPHFNEVGQVYITKSVVSGKREKNL
ncbi:hypothetical protein Pfo_016682 [Paulownia fortunei]|nr:hypothetical protein Pfo_016682 [Paulownia fortunei]